MVIKIMGAGCAKCTKLYESARKAVELTGCGAQVTKVSDLDEIARYGVFALPAIVVEGKVKSVGKLLSPEEITHLINN